MIYDYVLQKEVHSGKDSEGISSYATRRYDNYILLSTTQLSLIVGFITGNIARTASEYYATRFQLKDIPNLLGNFTKGSEFFVWLCLTITVIILVVAIGKGLKWIKFEYEEIHSAIVLDSKIKIAELKRLFPLYKFVEEEKQPQNPNEK